MWSKIALFGMCISMITASVLVSWRIIDNYRKEHPEPAPVVVEPPKLRVTGWVMEEDVFPGLTWILFRVVTDPYGQKFIIVSRSQNDIAIMPYTPHPPVVAPAPVVVPAQVAVEAAGK